jgi:hypothetical protein
VKQEAECAKREELNKIGAGENNTPTSKRAEIVAERAAKLGQHVAQICRCYLHKAEAEGVRPPKLGVSLISDCADETVGSVRGLEGGKEAEEHAREEREGKR